MSSNRQLDFEEMWVQLGEDLIKAIDNPPDNVSEKTREIAIAVFYNVLDDMKIITQEHELKRMKELEDKYSE